jgi:hypothetical protein
MIRPEGAMRPQNQKSNCHSPLYIVLIDHSPARGNPYHPRYFSGRSLMFLNQQGWPWSCKPM